MVRFASLGVRSRIGGARTRERIAGERSMHRSDEVYVCNASESVGNARKGRACCAPPRINFFKEQEVTQKSWHIQGQDAEQRNGRVMRDARWQLPSTEGRPRTSSRRHHWVISPHRED
jgi:hypothetical protein